MAPKRALQSIFGTQKVGGYFIYSPPTFKTPLLRRPCSEPKVLAPLFSGLEYLQNSMTEK